MKAITGLVVVLVATLPCRARQPDPKAESKDKTPDYYPLVAGGKRHYQVDLGKGRKVVILNQVSKIEDVDGKRLATVETVVNGHVQSTEVVGVNAEGIFRHRADDVPISPPACLLKYPVKEGEIWTAELKTGKRPITLKGKTGSKEEVHVPAGKYQAISVTIDMTSSGSQIRITSWFAPKVGMIKQLVERRDGQFTLELLKFESGQ